MIGAPPNGCTEDPGLTPEHGPEGVLKPGNKVGSGSLDPERGHHTEAGFLCVVPSEAASGQLNYPPRRNCTSSPLPNPMKATCAGPTFRL